MLFILACTGFTVVGFIVGVISTMIINGDFKEDLSKPNSDYD